MKLKIKRISKQKTKYGDDLVISMVGLYDDNCKWIKWVKLDDITINLLTANFINYEG